MEQATLFLFFFYSYIFDANAAVARLFSSPRKKKWKKMETSLKGRLIFFFSVRALLYPLYPKIPRVFE